MKTLDLLQKARKQLQEVAINPYQESLWILSEVLQCSATEIYLKSGDVTKNNETFFWDKIQRRKQKEPLEHILQEKFFFNQKFFVEPGVFIPRQETETLVKWVLKNVSDNNLKAVDLGAGSGTLCLSLLSGLANSQFVAVEISSKAISCLKKNSQTMKLYQRLKILKKDVSCLQKKDLIAFLGQAPSLIVANPPYVDPKDKSLSDEVFFFDPPLAIFSDQGGMGHIISWFKKAIQLLIPGGVYVFELGGNQLEPVKKFLSRENQLSFYEIHKDMLGHPRIVIAVKKENT